MPTYQYSCTQCGHFMEVVQGFTDDSLTVCPECEGRLRKVFGAVGVVFKGSGFYRNDSRGKDTSSSSESTKTESAAPAKTEKKSEKPAASTESKPAAKPA